MSLETVEDQVQQLNSSDFIKFTEWFREYERQVRDRPIESDATAGKPKAMVIVHPPLITETENQSLAEQSAANGPESGGGGERLQAMDDKARGDLAAGRVTVIVHSPPITETDNQALAEQSAVNAPKSDEGSERLPTKPENQVKSKRRWVVDYWQLVVTTVVLVAVGSAILQLAQNSHTPPIDCANYAPGGNIENKEVREICEQRVADAKRAEIEQQSNASKEQANKDEEAKKQKLAQEQMQQLIAAIGGTRTLVEKELKGLTLSPLKIEERWPVSMFVSHLKNDGRDFVELLWNKPLANLKIENRGNVLQPLVKCRNAIRTLMGVKEEVHTPFFDLRQDFNGMDPSPSLQGTIEQWATEHKTDIEPSYDQAGQIIKGQIGCRTTQRTSTDQKTLLGWIDTCIKPIQPQSDDPVLKNIKRFGEACGSVKFAIAVK